MDSTGPINYATNATYAPQGTLASLQNGGSIVSTVYFNSRLQPCRMSVKSSGTAPANCTDTATGNVLDFTYGFSLGSADNGNVAAVTNNRDTTRSQSFTYDALNRLLTAKTSSTSGANCWDEALGYDPWGNFLTIGRISGYTCSNEELLNLTATTKNQVSGDTYDAAGNLINDGLGHAYTYNAENQLLTAGGVTYTYDGDGKRVQKSNGKLYWYGMDSDPLDETDLAGSTTNATFKEYIFFGGKRIARRDSSNNINYYFADHLGTARIVANSSGTVLDDSDFYPFGGERIVSSSSGNAYKFTGKERDAESGLDNFGARYNASSMGRFMSPDPLMASATVYDPQTWNRYTYALNNPLRFLDPDGMKEVSAEDCKKDANCVAVKVNVIYDRNANDGKGLTDQQKKDFQNQQLQNAKDQYGDADIHLDVTYTAGGFDNKGNLQGASKDSINVLVTDTGDVGVSGMTNNGYALTKININRSDKDTLSHELAHDFLGDTTGLVSRIAERDKTGIFGLVANAFEDVVNDGMREAMKNPSPVIRSSIVAPHIFNSGAKHFQQMLTQQAAIRPRQ